VVTRSCRALWRAIFLFAAVASLTVLASPLTASAKRDRRAPHVTSVRCWPPKTCGSNPHLVAPGGLLRFQGRNLRPGMAVRFRRAGKVRRSAAVVTARLRRSSGYLVTTVPLSAKSGRIRVAAKRGRRSNAAGPIRIRRPARPLQVSQTPLDGTGMWIWYVRRSSGGTPAGIILQAQRYGVRTVFVKSSDGASWWSQFTPELVSALRAGGLRVCAWQFVYGSSPASEAALGARAAQTGADCLVIDAESAYEGKYAQAQSYVAALRAKVGADYPLALSGFPYVDYHPSFPYSVFLAPGGAQYNLPQVYWKAIGTSVDRALGHTYTWNGVYQRPIYPLGQLYDNPKPADVKRFRQLASAYGATGISWWSWQSASAQGWAAINAAAPVAAAPPTAAFPTLGRGSRGDVVVWAQQHLLAAGQAVKVNGTYDAATEQAVRNFQTAAGLPVTGQADLATWPLLLRYQPAPVDWANGGKAASLRRQGPGGPASARLPAVRNELRGVAH
jgi:hypothetical protein